MCIYKRNVNRARPNIRSIQRFCTPAASHGNLKLALNDELWRALVAFSYYSFEAAVRTQCHRRESRGRTNAHMRENSANRLNAATTSHFAVMDVAGSSNI